MRNTWPEFTSLMFPNSTCKWLVGSTFVCWISTVSAPSHYVNQYWNIVDWTPRNKLQWNFDKNLYIFIQENAFENVVCKNCGHLVLASYVNSCLYAKSSPFGQLYGPRCPLSSKRPINLISLSLSPFGQWLQNYKQYIFTCDFINEKW